MRALLVVAAVSAAFGVGMIGAGARAAAAGACGGATPLRGSPVLRLGPLRIAGFSSDRCAEIALGCGPKAGGNQAPLSLELSKKLAAPVVLRASAAAVTFVLVGNATPAPKVPRCVSSSQAHPTAKLRVRDMYFVLFVFAPKRVTFHLTAWSGSRRLGDVVIGAAGA